MSFFLQPWNGDSIENASEDDMRVVLHDLLLNADDEHPDAWVKEQSGWTLSFTQRGRLTWENIREEPPSGRHMENVAPERVLELWKKLAAGDLAAIEAEPWLPGY